MSNVLPIEEVFSNWEGFLYFSDEPDLNKPDGYDLTKAKVFDNFVTEAGGLLYFGNPPGYEVIYHYYGEEVIEAKGDVLKALEENDLYPDIEALGLDDLVRNLIMKEV